MIIVSCWNEKIRKSLRSLEGLEGLEGLGGLGGLGGLESLGGLEGKRKQQGLFTGFYLTIFFCKQLNIRR